MTKLKLRINTKKEITKEFSRLKSFGFEVITFNDNRPLRSQQKNFVDHLLFNHKFVVFVEVKLGTDKLNENQERVMNKLSAASVFNKNMDYKLIHDLQSTKRLVDNLLQGKI